MGERARAWALTMAGQGAPRRKVVMPHGWLDTHTLDDDDLSAAEIDASGG